MSDMMDGRDNVLGKSGTFAVSPPEGVTNTLVRTEPGEGHPIRMTQGTALTYGSGG